MCLAFLHSHGGTGCGSAHRPFFATLASFSNFSSSRSPGAYFLYHQHQPTLTEETLMTLFKCGDLAIGTHYQVQFSDAAHKTPRHLDGPKALAYVSTLCNIHGGQGITCQPKNITVLQRAPLRPIPLLRPSHSADSYAAFATVLSPALWPRNYVLRL